MLRTFRYDPIRVSQRKRQLLDGASKLFAVGKQSRDKDEGQDKEGDLFQQIGRLQMELEWLKKRLSCSGVHELRKLVDHEHKELKESPARLQSQTTLFTSIPR
jgi:putative transposase